MNDTITFYRFCWSWIKVVFIVIDQFNLHVSMDVLIILLTQVCLYKCCINPLATYFFFIKLIFKLGIYYIRREFYHSLTFWSCFLVNLDTIQAVILPTCYFYKFPYTINNYLDVSPNNTNYQHQHHNAIHSDLNWILKERFWSW